MRTITGRVICILCGVLSLISAAAAESSAEPIELQEPIRIASARGDLITLGAGRYFLRAARDGTLVVVSERDGSEVKVAARPAQYRQRTDMPRALLISGSRDVRLVLLLPDGTSMEAAGSSSGTATASVVQAPVEQRLTTSPRRRVVLRPREALRKVVQPQHCQNNTYPPPYISSHQPAELGMAGSELVINGQNLVPDSLVAWIGDSRLETVQASPSRIAVRLPGNRLVGDLVVGYCTAQSNYILDDEYRVHGEPQIHSVAPAQIFLGERVTVTGYDLDMAGALEGSAYQDSPGKTLFALIHNSSTSAISGNNVLPRLEMIDPVWSPDGRSVSFNAGRMYRNALMSPQPAAVSGRLRLMRAGAYNTPNVYTVAGPVVNWRPDTPLAFTQFFGVPFDESNIVILGDFPTVGTSQGQRWSLYVRGRGFFDGTSARLGTIDVTDHFPSDLGDRMRLLLPPESTSGTVTITRGSQSLTTPFVTVLPGPKFMPQTLNMMGDLFHVEIGKTYDLRGWYLRPSGIQGLDYRFSIPSLSIPSLELEVLQHTTSLIRFRIAQVGPLDANSPALNQLLNADDPWRSLRITAQFGDSTSDLTGSGFVRYRLVMP